MKRKVLVLIVALVTMLALVGCGDTSSNNDETTLAAEIETTVEETTETTVEETTEATTETTTEATTENKAEKETKKATEAKKKETKSTKAKKKPTKANQKESTKEEEPATKATTQEQTTEATEAAASVCYVTVEGYCSSKEITLSGGDTAYSVLKATGASVSARNSEYGVYVEGINGRFEFDEGPTSGWMYSVNGTAPNKSAGKYKISKGDKVKWYYVN